MSCILTRDGVKYIEMRNRRAHSTALAVVTSLLVGTATFGCSATGDVQSSSRAAANSEMPRWIREGVAQAQADAAGAGGLSTVDGKSPPASAGTTGGLPAKSVLVSALTAQGMTAEQANCVYDSVSADPVLATTVGAALTASATGSAKSGASDDGTAGAQSLIGALAVAGTDTTAKLVTALSPCLDARTLLLLGGAGTSPGAETATTAALEDLIGSDNASLLASLAAMDPAEIAQKAAGALGPDAVGQLTALLTQAKGIEAAVAAGTFSPEQLLATIDPAVLDLAKLDLGALTAQQQQNLVISLVNSLAAGDKLELADLLKLDLTKLDGKLNPIALDQQQIMALLVAFIPTLAGIFSPPSGTPGTPGGGLGDINPLAYLDRGLAIQQLASQGLSTSFATCLFDQMKGLPADTIAPLFVPDAGPPPTGQIVTIAIQCLLQ